MYVYIYICVCVMLHKSYFDSVMNFESAGVPYFGVKARQSSHEGGKQRPRTTPRTRMQRSQWRIPVVSTGAGVETFVKKYVKETAAAWNYILLLYDGYYENGYYMINDG